MSSCSPLREHFRENGETWEALAIERERMTELHGEPVANAASLEIPSRIWVLCTGTAGHHRTAAGKERYRTFLASGHHQETRVA